MRSHLFRTLAFTLLAPLAALTALPAGAASESTDRDLAADGVIVASDLPSTWASAPDDNSGDANVLKVATKTKGCAAYVAARKAVNRAPSAESREFSIDNQDISNKVWVFPTARDATKVFSNMSHATVAKCLTDVQQKILDEAVPGDPTVKSGRIVVGKASNLPAIGDDVVAYNAAAQLNNADGSIDRFPLANIVVRVGRSIISYAVSGAPSATGGYTSDFLAAADSAASATVGRMEDALR